MGLVMPSLLQEYCEKQLETYPFDSTNLLRDEAKVLVTLSESLTMDLKRLEIIVEVCSAVGKWCCFI